MLRRRWRDGQNHQVGLQRTQAGKEGGGKNKEIWIPSGDKTALFSRFVLTQI